MRVGGVIVEDNGVNAYWFENLKSWTHTGKTYSKEKLRNQCEYAFSPLCSFFVVI